MANMFQAQLGEHVYNFLAARHQFQKRMKLIPVDFNQPWWIVLAKQKVAFAIVMVFAIIDSIFGTVFPLLIGIAVASLDWQLLLLIILAKIGLSILSGIINFINTIFHFRSAESVNYSANLFFLTTDPVNHTTKSSGQVISKINRGYGAYDSFLDILGTEIVPIIINLITIPIILLRYQTALGLSAITILIVVATVNIFGGIFRIKIYEPKTITAEDKQKAVAIENLQQAPYIRYCFATIEQAKRIGITAAETMTAAANSRQFDDYIGIITKVLSYSGMIWIGWQTFQLAGTGVITPIIASTLIISYYNSSENVGSAGKFVRRITRSYVYIQDLFKFIRGFGKASYPVLEGVDKK